MAVEEAVVIRCDVIGKRESGEGKSYATICPHASVRVLRGAAPGTTLQIQGSISSDVH
jgi:hypothetical protein